MFKLRGLLMMLLFGGILSVPAAGAELEAMTWEQSIKDLAAKLCAVDQTAAEEMLRDVPLSTFGDDTPARPLTLLAHAAASRVVSIRAYPELPDNAARNLAEDFAASDLPESVKRPFIPTTAEQLRHADQLAAQWLRDSLRLVRPAPVAMLVLWRGDDALPSLSSEHYRNHVIFIMVRGELRPDGTVRPAAIVFGNPLMAS
jgi:hypothetical protein